MLEPQADAALDIHHIHLILPLHPAQRGAYPAVETDRDRFTIHEYTLTMV